LIAIPASYNNAMVIMPLKERTDIRFDIFNQSSQSLSGHDSHVMFMTSISTPRFLTTKYQT
jgi:hypothetical protein